MEQSTGGAILKKPPDGFVKNVLLLKKSDFQRIGGQVYMPTESEISTIKTTPHLDQFKKGVQFSASMSEDKIKEKLQVTFSYLKNRRFFCAGVVKLDKEYKRFEFHGSPHVWNGKTIRSKIKGNSTLYILEDEIPNSDTELTSDTPQGEDDTMNSITTNVNQISLLPNDSQMETDDGLRGAQGDDSMAMQSGNDNNTHPDQLQMSDSSEGGFSSLGSATTSGIGGEYSEDELSSMVQWLQNAVNYEVCINPRYSPLQGGAPCRFTFSPPLQPEVTSGRAMFGNIAPVELERMKNGSLLGTIPASPVPGWVPVIVESQDGVHLGQTEIEYQGDLMEVALQQIVMDPSLQQRLFLQMLGRSGDNTGTSGSEAQNSRILGFTQPVQMLSLLVYAAAENGGALPFIEMIFTSSAGRVVFASYKGNYTLPEVIARNHGNDETAHFLEDITKRFSEEIKTGKEYPQTVDWSELAKAAEAAQKQLDNGSEKENIEIETDVPKETGYLGDVDTCSSESSEPQSSDSEDDISTTSSKAKGCVDKPKNNLLEDGSGDTSESSSDQINKTKKMAATEALTNTVSKWEREMLKRGTREAAEEASSQTESKVAQELMKRETHKAAKEALTVTASKVEHDMIKTGIHEATEEVLTQTSSTVGEKTVKSGIRVDIATQIEPKTGQEVVKTGVHQETEEVLNQAASNVRQIGVQQKTRDAVTQATLKAGQEIVKIGAQEAIGEIMNQTSIAGQEVAKTGVPEGSEEFLTQTASKSGEAGNYPGAVCSPVIEGSNGVAPDSDIMMNHLKRITTDLQDLAIRYDTVLKENEALKKQLSETSCELLEKNRLIEELEQRKFDTKTLLMESHSSAKKMAEGAALQCQGLNREMVEKTHFIIALQMKLLTTKEEVENLKERLEESIQQKNELLDRFTQISKNYDHQRRESMKLTEKLEIQKDNIQKAEELKVKFRQVQFSNQKLRTERDEALKELEELKCWTEVLKARYLIVEEDRNKTQESHIIIVTDYFELQERADNLKLRLKISALEIADLKKQCKDFEQTANVYRQQRDLYEKTWKETSAEREQLRKDRDDAVSRLVEVIFIRDEVINIQMECSRRFEVQLKKTVEELNNVQERQYQTEMEMEVLRKVKIQSVDSDVVNNSFVGEINSINLHLDTANGKGAKLEGRVDTEDDPPGNSSEDCCDGKLRRTTTSEVIANVQKRVAMQKSPPLEYSEDGVGEKTSTTRPVPSGKSTASALDSAFDSNSSVYSFSSIDSGLPSLTSSESRWSKESDDNNIQGPEKFKDAANNSSSKTISKLLTASQNYIP